MSFTRTITGFAVYLATSLAAPAQTVTDIDGNTYKTITLGTQEWMAQNLRTTTYCDGTAIPNVKETATWSTLSATASDAYCSYNNTTDTAFIRTYGMLYNWYAATTGKLCPSGWHVPSSDEWQNLQVYLKNNGYNYFGGNVENDVGKAMASTTGWEISTDEGDVGYEQETNNASSFNAYPSGWRTGNSFYRLGTEAYWWSTTQHATNQMVEWVLHDDNSGFYFSYYGGGIGMAIRCVKDSSTFDVGIHASDSTVCPGSPVMLTADTSGSTSPVTYTWGTGDTVDSVMVRPTVTTTYTVTVQDSSGQTASSSITITVLQPTYSTVSALFNEGGIYIYNGTAYTAAGTYTATFTNAAGCDSTVTLVLDIIDSSTCTGSYGETFVNETFGSGSNYGPELASGTTSSLRFSQRNCPNDGYYAITNYTSGCWPLPDVAWETMTDHTGNTSGYFMLVNASHAASDFFIKNVTGLCEGTIYKFSSWIMNVCTNGGNMPNITFSIEMTNDSVLASHQSGDIASATDPQWKEYSLYFQTPAGVSDVVLRMRNNAPGGVGNDLALDDITFRPVGPTITMNVPGTTTDTLVTCQGDEPVELQAVVESCYDSTVYQWQRSMDDGATWDDVDEATGQSCTALTSTAGQYLYRLVVAQAGNISSSYCRVTSSPLLVTVTARVYSSIDTSICQGESFLGYTTAGTHVDTLTSLAGCDSIRTVNLIIKEPTSSTSTATIPRGESYLFNGTSYTDDGTYTTTLTNAAGCDSTATLVLDVIDQPHDTTLEKIICQGDTLLLNGSAYSQAGTYTQVMTSTSGQDSTVTLILHVNLPTSSSTMATICQGESYTFNGKMCSTAGTYTDTLVNATGCDSIATLVLTINQPTTSTTTATICQGESYTFNGKTCSTAGTYTDTLVNATGCDSIATLILGTTSSSAEPSVWITATTTLRECDSSRITTFTAVSVDGGINPTFQWKLNGNSVGTGGDSYTVTNLSLYDRIHCEMTTVATCSPSVIVASNTIVIRLLEAGVIDIESSTYKSVDIGGQTWMAENLKTTTYNDGTAIPTPADTNYSIWQALTRDAYCNYKNSDDTGRAYGRLYNWYAASNGKLCPSGWHIPTEADWTTLQEYLTSNGYNYDGTTSGNKVGKALASSTLWTSSTIAGAVGNNMATNNSTGFTALPFSHRSANVNFQTPMGISSLWWSSTSYDTTSAYSRFLLYTRPELVSKVNLKVAGFAVRCVRQADSANTMGLELDASDSMVCPGNTVILAARVCGGVKPLSYTWSSGDTSMTISNTPASTITLIVTVHDANEQVAVGSMTVTVSQATSSIIIASINYGNSYLFNGKAYSEAGTYTDTLVNAAGCDSITTLVLAINQPTHSTITATICQGESYNFNGKSCSAAGTYTDTLQGASGSDSIMMLVLTVREKTSSRVSATVCGSDTYLFNGMRYGTGTHFVILENQAGCDSVVTLEVIGIMNTSSMVDTTICQGGSYTFNGKTYSLAGTYTDTLANAAGCDSIVTLRVVTSMLNPVITGDKTLCEGDASSYAVQGRASGSSLAWYIDQEELPAKANKETIEVTFAGTGAHMLGIEETLGSCSAQDTVHVLVSPLPSASFSRVIDETTSTAEFTAEMTEITIQDGSTSYTLGNTSTWLFGDGDTLVGTPAHVTHQYLPGTYLATLWVINDFGCSDSASMLVYIDTTSQLYIPTAFSPSSASPGVRLFTPKGTGLEEYHIFIYDVWGNLLWYSDTLTPSGQPAESWPGIYDGVVLPRGCYIWKVDASFKNGRSMYKWGSVILVP